MNKTQKSGMDMTTGEPFKLLVIYSLPILFGSLFQQLYNMFDTIIVGRLLGSSALAAVGNTGPMNFLVLGFLYGMTSGFAVITAQRFGAKDAEGLKRSVAMNIILNASVALIMTILACSLTRTILKLIHTPDDIIEGSFSYIFVIFSGIPFIVMYNACTCVLRAVGDSKTPLYFLIVASILNIILDIVFIAKFNMSIAGAAWATVIANAFSAILSFIWIIVKYPELHVAKRHFAWNSSFAFKHLNIGMSMGFQFSITAIGTIVLEGALNKFGSTKIAAFTAAQKVQQLVTVAAGVMGISIANYGGQNLGAGRIDRIKEGVTKAIIISVSFAVLAAVLSRIFYAQFIGLFLDRNNMDLSTWNEILSSAKQYLDITTIFYPVLFVLFIYRNILQSIGKGFWPLMGGVFELVARSLGAFTLPSVIGFAGICMSDMVAWFAAGIPLAIAYYIILYGKEFNQTDR